METAKIKNTSPRRREWSIWASLASLTIATFKGIGKVRFAKRLMALSLIAICLLVIFTQCQSAGTDDVAVAQTPTQFPNTLPPAQSHPLPSTLAQWQDTTNSGDYFSQVKQTRVNYLVWSQFPVKVYVERPPADPVGQSSENRRFQQWAIAVSKAVQEWSQYLPLTVVEQQSMADITILRSRPPLQPSFNRNTGALQLPRARSAQTSYELYVSQPSGGTAILSHRCTIRLSPNQNDNYIQAAARHELGHALGIWGHSPLDTDALYFSQVRNPLPISLRDINTLKRVYEQPTRLGWPLVP